jgi:hypothetical protein
MSKSPLCHRKFTRSLCAISTQISVPRVPLPTVFSSDAIHTHGTCHKTHLSHERNLRKPRTGGGRRQHQPCVVCVVHRCRGTEFCRLREPEAWQRGVVPVRKRTLEGKDGARANSWSEKTRDPAGTDTHVWTPRFPYLAWLGVRARINY